MNMSQHVICVFAISCVDKYIIYRLFLLFSKSCIRNVRHIIIYAHIIS